MNTLHFWPEDIASNLPASPVTILREAAAELGEATKGAIEAEVKMDTERSNKDRTMYDFVLSSKALGFRYELFTAYFRPQSFYPCGLIFESENTVARDENEMRERLISILRSKVAVSVVKTMLAQSVVT